MSIAIVLLLFFVCNNHYHVKYDYFISYIDIRDCIGGFETLSRNIQWNILHSRVSGVNWKVDFPIQLCMLENVHWVSNMSTKCIITIFSVFDVYVCMFLDSLTFKNEAIC